MKNPKIAILLIMVIGMTLSMAGCTKHNISDNPVTVHIWHVYGGQTDSPLNDLIEKFNKTVGKEKGIRVQVTSVSNTNSIHEAVIAAAYDDPGAPKLPDMFVSYPKTVLAMPDNKKLVNYEDYLSKEELSEFIPEFIEEGKIKDKLVILPVAKSTEVLFVNKTIFNRFSEATGAKMSDLSTWEGLYDTALKYVKWTDGKTPDIPNDGKVFFVHDFPFNYFQIGVESFGEDFFNDDKKISFNDTFKKVWEPYAKAAISGGIWLQSGYATEPLRTGDAVVSVASSASVLYYSKTVTYPDNTSEPAEIIALPCPTFKEGKKLVMQRGAGICTVKSSKEKEKASIEFLRWLTAPERNVEFATELGYIPVKQKSFDKYLPKAIDKLKDPKYKSLYGAFMNMQKDYTFFVPPKFDEYLDLETTFEKKIRQQMEVCSGKYMNGGYSSIDAAVEDSLESFKTI